MSPEAQRIAIAEACGYIWERGCFGTPLGRKKNEPGPYEDLPNYLNDLNAMHEAEKLVAEECKEHAHWFYIRQVVGFSDAQCDWDEVDHFKAVHTTAAQRAEAFLRTIGKWEDGQ